jgi:hypothetical protein
MNIDDVLGHVTIEDEWPIVYGQQIPGTIVRTFNGRGELVKTAHHKPVIRIIYPSDPPAQWWEVWK